ncbi:MAG TPA: lasso peptide biosynthesis B2 protein [Methylomirabilota bacterium]
MNSREGVAGPIPAGRDQWTRWRLAAELWGWAVVLRPLKHLVPLPLLVRLSRWSRWRRPSAATVALLRRQMAPAAVPDVRLPGNCLERSLAVYRLLCRTEGAAQVVVGVRREGHQGIDGHVWLLLDGEPLWDSPEFLAAYEAVLAFDGAGRLRRCGV